LSRGTTLVNSRNKNTGFPELPYDYGTVMRVRPEFGDNPACSLSGVFHENRTDEFCVCWSGTGFSWYTKEPVEFDAKSFGTIIFYTPTFTPKINAYLSVSKETKKLTLFHLIDSFLEPDPIGLQKTKAIKKSSEIGDLVKNNGRILGLSGDPNGPLILASFNSLIIVEKQDKAALCLGTQFSGEQILFSIPWALLWKHYE